MACEKNVLYGKCYVPSPPLTSFIAAAVAAVAITIAVALAVAVAHYVGQFYEPLLCNSITVKGCFSIATTNIFSLAKPPK